MTSFEIPRALEPVADRIQSKTLSRRLVLRCGLGFGALPLWVTGCPSAFAQASSAAAPSPNAPESTNGPALAAFEVAVRSGGVVLAFRHALAPGTFDPDGFKLGDCRTQRNLNDQGRAQATQTGEWFKQRQLAPVQVLSSPWCRCMDSARLAFGRVKPWAELGSPRGAIEATNAAALKTLKHAVAKAASQPGRFDVWVTHMFVLSPLADTPVQSGEALVLAPDGRGGVRVVARAVLA